MHGHLPDDLAAVMPPYGTREVLEEMRSHGIYPEIEVTATTLEGDCIHGVYRIPSDGPGEFEFWYNPLLWPDDYNRHTTLSDTVFRFYVNQLGYRRWPGATLWIGGTSSTMIAAATFPTTTTRAVTPAGSTTWRISG